jgi:hypothetical protein
MILGLLHAVRGFGAGGFNKLTSGGKSPAGSLGRILGGLERQAAPIVGLAVEVAEIGLLLGLTRAVIGSNKPRPS